MLSEVCSAYGWTAQYALDMPARLFYAMRDGARMVKLRDYMDSCDIAAIPSGGSRIHKELTSKAQAEFNRLWGASDKSAPRSRQLEGDEANRALMQMLGGGRRG